MWRRVVLALTDGSDERIFIFMEVKFHELGTSVSRGLQTEPRVRNNQLYKNRE
jgi:hypothetical protein